MLLNSSYKNNLRKQAKRHKNAGKKDIWAVGIVYENVQKPYSRIQCVSANMGQAIKTKKKAEKKKEKWAGEVSLRDQCFSVCRTLCKLVYLSCYV